MLVLIARNNHEVIAGAVSHHLGQLKVPRQQVLVLLIQAKLRKLVAQRCMADFQHLNFLQVPVENRPCKAQLRLAHTCLFVVQVAGILTSQLKLNVLIGGLIQEAERLLFAAILSHCPHQVVANGILLKERKIG